MKYFILAGEASGDKQAALLCAAIRQVDPSAEILGWGGEAMTDAGVTVTRHYRELAFMGFAEVVRHLPAILRNFRLARQEILTHKPDAVILVDYPGFNLRMAAWAAKRGFKIYYYISPQLWAWHTSRVHQIRKAVRRMYVILPFEEEFYAKFDVAAMYIGHPLAMAIARDSNYRYDPAPDQIALLPGSRRHEVERMLPVMADLARGRTDLTFVVAAVPHLAAHLYDDILAGVSNVRIVHGDMQGVLARSRAAIVTSGTATLETALLGVPQVVVYKGSALSYQIARRLIKVRFISLVNLIAGKALIPELIQHECTAGRIGQALQEILAPDREAAIRAGYLEVADALVSGGGAAAAAVDLVADCAGSPAGA